MRVPRSYLNILAETEVKDAQGHQATEGTPRGKMPIAVGSEEAALITCGKR